MEEKILKILKPFGPSLGKVSIPHDLIVKINNFIDEVISDKTKSKKYNFGNYLAGQVTQEIVLPNEITDGELMQFLATSTKAYVEEVTKKKITKFTLIKCWVVRQFSGEYNPVHYHSGHISGAGYLKLPKDFGKSIQTEKSTNPNGYINFIHGSKQFLSNSIVTNKPELGDCYLFPNYLMHSVNPFYGEGERRSVSFNAFIDDEVFNYYLEKN